MNRIDLKTGFLCNNNCKFCVQAHKKKFGNKKTSTLKRSLREAARNFKAVVFTGGEVTLREDALELVSYARSLGYSLIQIQSNGRMFVYKDVCERFISAGANEFALALHGHIPQLHDYLTSSPGSFHETLRGIQNLIVLGQKVITNTVISKPNYRHLHQVAQLLVKVGVRQYQFAFVHIMGNALKNKESIVPRVSMVIPYVKKGLAIGREAGLLTHTEAIPYCLMEGYEDCIAESYMSDTKIYDMDYIIESFTETRRKEAKSKSRRCSKCIHYSKCEGPWKEYPEIFGWSEFVPVA